MSDKPTLTVRGIDRHAPGSHADSRRLKELILAQREARDGNDLNAFLRADLALIAWIEARCETDNGVAPADLLAELSQEEFDDLAQTLLGNRPAPATTNAPSSAPTSPAPRPRPPGSKS